ncbi:hypothetical protein P1X15_08405 [Runella sp. MFBS21]|uniref:hypothetical protein n=1 Tax=Runella sp. MFBS21 TaxID=3034018 RepID=UPI0023F797A7|nr:hypothetical protein [Runella sp. MFBS21]MDF7817614.1 hypothetical protein [Runella sp. MFBS21]
MPKPFFTILLLWSLQAYTQNIPLVNPPQSPLVFEPASTGAYERDFALSPDGTEMYWSVVTPKNIFSAIVGRKLIKGQWSPPQVASFSGQFSDLEPAFSPDGKRLYFASNRPVTPNDSTKDFDIWYVERTSAGWSLPKNMGVPINTPDADEYYPSLTSNGTLYFTAIYKNGLGKDDLWRSEWVDGQYTSPKLVDKPISTEGYEFNAYVLPDESKLFYTSCFRKNGVLDCDLVVSSRLSDGSWSSPKPLEGVNSDKLDYCPFVSPDGKILFFTSERAPKNWDLTKPLSYQDLQKRLQSPHNGEADLYWVELKSVLPKP